ncbi:hypothetical protein BBJ28_00008810 [Nothophytophthora sp. Chile5]|nr:hypothetical protein BBJ28_00008810 [Nothophytophthora sp. Chile5]
MRDAKPALTLTLADVRSGSTTSSLGERSKSLSSVVWTRHTRRRSSLSTDPGKTQPRRNSYTGLDIKTEGLQLPETTTAIADGSEALVNDLKAQHLEVSQQLSEARQQLSAKNREHEEAVAREQNEAAKQLESLLLESRKLQRERDDMIAVNKLLLRHKRASATTQAELEAAKAEQLQLQRRQEELEQSLQDLQTQLAEQTLVTQESQALAAQLRHEKEVLTLQWQELQEEHRDTQSHVDELHDRLVDAQRAHRAVESMLTALRTTHAAQAQQLQELQEAAEVAKLRADAASQAEESDTSVDQTVAVLASEAALPPPPQAAIEPIIATLAIQQRLQDERFEVEQHRDELLAELSCQEQKLQQLQEQVHALELVNATSKRLLASLHEELREAQTRERNMRVEFGVELEVVRKSAAQDALQRQVHELEQRCEGERAEKQRLQLALDTLENAARARVAANAKEQDFLAQFKRQLVSGVVVTKFGSHGVPHQRVVYSDPQCHWLSWRPLPTSSYGSLVHPKTDAKADTCDLVEVLAGATTEPFARQRPDAPTRCFSLVFVHPCRTLDLQADTAAQCQQYLRGFRLLQEEAALKRQ